MSIDLIPPQPSTVLQEARRLISAMADQCRDVQLAVLISTSPTTGGPVVVVDAVRLVRWNDSTPWVFKAGAPEPDRVCASVARLLRYLLIQQPEKVREEAATLQALLIELGVPQRRSYESLHCPMPGCTGDLYVTATESMPVYQDPEPGDFTPGSGTTSGWEVVCSEGHTIMLPSRHADDHERFGQPCDYCTEEGEQHDDIADLLAMVRAVRGETRG